MITRLFYFKRPGWQNNNLIIYPA